MRTKNNGNGHGGDGRLVSNQPVSPIHIKERGKQAEVKTTQIFPTCVRCVTVFSPKRLNATELLFDSLVGIQFLSLPIEPVFTLF